MCFFSVDNIEKTGGYTHLHYTALFTVMLVLYVSIGDSAFLENIR